MKVIADARIYEVEGDVHVSYHVGPSCGLSPHVMVKRGDEVVPLHVKTYQKHIQGRRITTVSGETVVLGLSGEVADLLGMHDEAWHALVKERDKALQDLSDAIIKTSSQCIRIDELQSATFWQRIKWVFTGVK